MLGAIGPHIPARLIALDTLRLMADIGVHFPMSATPVFGFECPLGTDNPEADILTYHNSKTGAAALLSNIVDGVKGSKKASNSWSQINHFANKWQQMDAEVKESIDDFWLEFDVRAFDNEGIPEPSFFFGPLLYPFTRLSADNATNWKNHLLVVIKKALYELGESASSDWATLQNCIENLPEHGRVFQVGKMLARATTGFRICLHNLSPQEVVDYNRRLLGPLNVTRQLEDWVNQLSPFTRKICPAYDISEGVAGKVGVEFYFNHPTDGHSQGCWEGALEALVERGYCTPIKKQALLAYPKLLQARENELSWPPGLLSMQSFMGGRQQSSFELSLHHLKLSLTPGKAPVAKAYLAVEHQWLPVGTEQKEVLNPLT